MGSAIMLYYGIKLKKKMMMMTTTLMMTMMMMMMIITIMIMIIIHSKHKTWEYIREGDLKLETVALIFAAQEQALSTNYVKYNIDKSVESPLCRLCGQKGETINHILYRFSQGRIFFVARYKFTLEIWCW